MAGFQKNVAGQKWRVFAFDRTDNTSKTGDAAQITAKIAKDDGTATALGDTDPTETEDGFYLFDLTQAETDADKLSLYPESSTADIQVIGSPADSFTVPPAFADSPVSDLTDALVMVDTTIATLATQISFTLTAGSADNDAYNGHLIVIEDAATGVQRAVGYVFDYVGSTKTITLARDPGIFVMAVTDKVRILSINASELADAQLDRILSVGKDSGTDTTTGRTQRQALRVLRNKMSISGTTMTHTKEDDVTASHTSTLSTDATADPVTGIDPA